MASSSEVPDEQYETQFFGFSPSIFVAGVKELIFDRLFETMNQLENHLSQVPQDILPPDEMEQGIRMLREQTDKNFAKTFQKFESHVLQNVMKVPSHVLLPTDVEQTTQSSAIELNVLNTDIETLQVQLKNEKYMQARIKEELQDIDSVLKEQQKVLNGTLSDSQMSTIEEAKEKLFFIQGNAAETQEASAQLFDVSKHLNVEGILTPPQILATKIFKESSDD